MEKLSKKDRQARAKKKIEYYEHLTYLVIKAVLDKDFGIPITQRERLGKALLAGDRKFRELIKENPQEKNLIEKAAYNMVDGFREMCS